MVTPATKGVVLGVLALGLFKGLLELPSLPQLMEGRAFLVRIPEVPESVTSMATPNIPPPSNVVINLLTEGLHTFPFEGQLARPEEPIGVPSLLCSPFMAQLIISPLLTSLASTMEISDMLRLVNEDFHCLGGFNLDLQQAYDGLFHLLCLHHRLLIFWKEHERNYRRERASLEAA